MSLKVATWNVEYGMGPTLNDRRREKIREENADIWILTESNESLELEGFRSFDSETREVGGRVDDKSHWVSIWVSERLESAPLKKFVAQRWVACEVIVEGRSVIVVGTVLPWLGDTQDFTTDLEGQASIWQELSTVGAAGLIVAGDFNQDFGVRHYYGSRARRELLESTLTKSDLILATNQCTQVDREGFGLIDHVAHSKEWLSNEEDTKVWARKNHRGKRMSDHCGVAVELNLVE